MATAEPNPSAILQTAFSFWASKVLLSAVELGTSKGEVFDSAQFRALVQEDVAHRMENLEVKSLLPVSLIRRVLAYAAVVVVWVAVVWVVVVLVALVRRVVDGGHVPVS